MRKALLIFLTFLCWGWGNASAQKAAMKTNALYWATSTPNLALELGLADRWTLDVTGGYNPWTLNEKKNRKLKHWLVMPEARYWLCEAFQGHFFGLHSGYAYYNLSNVRLPLQKKSMKDHRYQGWATGLGLSYGYSWILGKRWNLEASIGLGYVYTQYDQYECITCGEHQGKKDKHYFGPTKAAVSIIYMLK